jgi:hypothetical protein
MEWKSFPGTSDRDGGMPRAFISEVRDGGGMVLGCLFRFGSTAAPIWLPGVKASWVERAGAPVVGDLAGGMSDLVLFLSVLCRSGVKFHHRPGEPSHVQVGDLEFVFYREKLEQASQSTGGASFPSERQILAGMLQRCGVPGLIESRDPEVITVGPVIFKFQGDALSVVTVKGHPRDGDDVYRSKEAHSEVAGAPGSSFVAQHDLESFRSLLRSWGPSWEWMERREMLPGIPPIEVIRVTFGLEKEGLICSLGFRADTGRAIQAIPLQRTTVLSIDGLKR